MSIPTIGEIGAAAERIAGRAHRTPVLTCGALDELAGARLFFKCENLQKAGAFKFRGACNAVLSLADDQAARGVVTHSSGNHAAALALAARLRGIPAHIVMPDNAPAAKRRAVEAYGGRITFCRPTLADRTAVASRILDETGGVLVHPYDNPAVIAGQGTVALELHEQAPGLDQIVAPVSGGGLISGIALATAAVSPRTEIVGVEPELAADAQQSLQAGSLLPPQIGDTIADGLRAALCERTFAVISQHVREILTVTEAEIVAAMRLIWERVKLVVEPSSAVTLAAVLKEPTRFRGMRVGLVLSGGNVDLDRLPWS
ncbi:MAG TPA: pyridoxal-phosphate dependent enzyme [Candidatus Anammoximicrobium sp.]|nr:pyridoxal-phosphate dependent enzyme [Candidatus Anammoximicrobium sp.]